MISNETGRNIVHLKQHCWSLAVCLLGCFSSHLSYASQNRGVSTDLLAFAPVATMPDRPVTAWLDYCVRHSDDCQTDLRQPLRIALTSQILKRLRIINSVVNARVHPLTDLQHWGVKDHWDQAEDGYGDCEDFQLLKRKQLVDAGVPRRATLMTVARDAETMATPY